MITLLFTLSDTPAFYPEDAQTPDASVSETPSSCLGFYEKCKDSWAYRTFEQAAFFAPQGWEALWEIGPVDAGVSGVIGIGIAEYASAEKYPGASPTEEHRNAFRHCYGSCLSYQEVGDDALIAMDIHEKYGGPQDGICDSAIDRFNNNVGVSYARDNPDGSCYDYCSEEINSRGLMLDPANPDSAQDASVAETCD